MPVLILAALGVGCPGGEQPTEQPSAAEPPRERPAPAPVEPVADPAPAAPATGSPVENGARLYALYCASCHGPRGDGDGPVAQGLDPRPARHSDGAYMNALSDEYLHRVIAEGGPAVGKSPLMAPWGSTLDEAQIRAVIAFIRSLADPPYRANPG